MVTAYAVGFLSASILAAFAAAIKQGKKIVTDAGKDIRV